MASGKGRPLITVPMGLKKWFMKSACPEGVSMIEEVREIDPTHPGLPEFEELIGGDIDDMDEPEAEGAPQSPTAAGDKPAQSKPGLRLATFNGRRLDR